MASAAMSFASVASMAALCLSGCGTASTLSSTTPVTPVTSTASSATTASTAAAINWTTPTPPAEPSDVWAVNLYNYTGLATQEEGDPHIYSCEPGHEVEVPWYWCEFPSRATFQGALWFLGDSDYYGIHCPDFQDSDPWNKVMNETVFEDLCQRYNNQSDEFLEDFWEFKAYPILNDILSLPSFAAKNITKIAARKIVTCLAERALEPHAPSCHASTLELACDGVPRTPVLQIGVVSVSVQGRTLEMEFPFGRPWMAPVEEGQVASPSSRRARSQHSLASWRAAMDDHDLGFPDFSCQDPRPFTTPPYTGSSVMEVSI